MMNESNEKNGFVCETRVETWEMRRYGASLKRACASWKCASYIHACWSTEMCTVCASHKLSCSNAHLDMCFCRTNGYCTLIRKTQTFSQLSFCKLKHCEHLFTTRVIVRSSRILWIKQALRMHKQTNSNVQTTYTRTKHTKWSIVMVNKS